ncbi:hypothetical protein SCORR_v1c05510 [Spiroplasma corruscae]|uniref:Lipoprotein n=1 Tax=Spiroplasma corruscae TaxID=216934 RepID=A0A222EPZ9_9MOLU|nr:hypothetical protein [Spiroplasma corruscae]ASP28323.1 hypothetical protein SCORR_v1c05510 [Spiroplasma corruscae]
MKKLVLILSSLTFTISPVFSIVSCGDSNDQSSDSNISEETPDPNNDTVSYETVRDSYLKEVNAITNSIISATRSNWIEATSDGNNQNQFFSIDTLKNFVNANKEIVNDGQLNSKTNKVNLDEAFNKQENTDYKNKFFEDIAKKINFDAIKTEISNIAKKIEYSILTNNVNNLVEISLSTLNNNNSDDKKATLTLYESGTTETNSDEPKSTYLASLDDTQITINFNYKSKDGTQLVNPPANNIFNFAYKITTEDNVVEYVKNKAKELKYKYFDSGATLIESGISNEDDKFESNDKLNDSNSNFKKSINALKSSLSNDLKPTDGISNVEIKTTVDKIIDDLDDNNNWSNTFNALNSKESIYSWKNDKINWKDDSIVGNPDLYNYIFRNQVTTSGDGVNPVENYLSGDKLETWFNDYKESIFKLYTDLDRAKFEEKINKTVKFSTFKLNGLVLEINGGNDNGGITTSIDNIDIAMGYTINKEEDLSTLKDNKDFVTYKSVLANLTKGIQSYHDTFGTTNTWNEDALTAMSGKVKGGVIEGQQLNIWKFAFDPNYICPTGENGLMYLLYGEFLGKFNESLSLSQKNGVGSQEQKIANNLLLSNGNQSHYSWNFDTTFGFRPQIRVNKVLPTENTIVDGKTEYGIIADGYYGGNDNRYTNMYFELDFMKINFRVDKIFWDTKMRYKAIIEYTNS